MKVVQLRDLLRTLPLDMMVLLGDLEGIFSAHVDGFEQVELSGEWGRTSLVITPNKLPFRRRRPIKPAGKSRPIERVRAHQRWVASKPQRDAWPEFGENVAESREKRTASDEQLNDLLAQVAPESRHPPRLG
jgi:hypothetical protein